jgi:hypothetical protein
MTKAWGLALTLLTVSAFGAILPCLGQSGGGTTSGVTANRTEQTGLGPAQLPPDYKLGTSGTLAVQLARDPWFDKAAQANPALVQAVCENRKAATILASHHHIAQIVEADPLLCRRLTRWHTATEALLRNPYADIVIEADPQGIYWAMARRPAYARVLAGHVFFYKMVADNPDIGRIVANYSR